MSEKYSSSSELTDPKSSSSTRLAIHRGAVVVARCRDRPLWVNDRWHP